MSSQKSLSEVKFALSDLLFDELGLKAQATVDLIEKEATMESLRARVMAMMKVAAAKGDNKFVKSLQQVFI